MNGRFFKLLTILGIFFIGLSLGSINIEGHDDRIQEDVDKGDEEIQTPDNDYDGSKNESVNIKDNFATSAAKALDKGIKGTFNGVIEGASGFFKFLFGK